MILRVAYSGDRPPFAFLRRLHRQQEISSGCRDVPKIRLQVADLEVARPVPAQDGVIPYPAENRATGVVLKLKAVG